MADAMREALEKKRKQAKLGSGSRFNDLTKEIEHEGKSEESAKAIAASIGRKKYGASKMGEMASKGRKK